MTSKKLLRVGVIADAMGLSRSRVYQLVEVGQIPSIRLGRSLFIPEAAWERWLAVQARIALGTDRRTACEVDLGEMVRTTEGAGRVVTGPLEGGGDA